MTKYNDILNELTAIQEELLAENNIYYLSDSEKNDAGIVTHALIYIVNHIDELKSTKAEIFYIPPPADEKREPTSLHLGVYRPKPEEAAKLSQEKIEEEIEKTLIGSLVIVFITSFHDAKKVSPLSVKRFCSYLDGHCMDGRTRLAYDYVAERLHNPPTFTEHLKDTFTKLDLRKKTSYFSVFTAILNHCWSENYSVDTGENGFCKIPGKFNEESFPLIKAALAQYFSLEPGDDFLVAIYNVRRPLHSVFLKFLLSHSDLLDQLEITSSASLTSTTYQYNQLFLSHFIPLADIVAYSDNLTLQQLLKRCHPETCVNAVLLLEQQGISKSWLCNLALEQLYEIQRKDAESFKEIVNQKNPVNGNTFLHVVARNRNGGSRALLQLTRLGADIQARNIDGNNPVDYAIIFNPTTANSIIEHFFLTNNDHHLISQLFGKTLQLAAKHGQLDLAEKLLNKNIYIEYNGSLTNAYFFIAIITNNVNLADLVYKKNMANLVNKPITVIALEEKCVTTETFSWLLDHPLGDINVTWENKSIFQIALETRNLEKIQQLLFYINDIKSAEDMVQQEQDTDHCLKLLALFRHPKLRLKLFEKKLVEKDDKGAAELLNKAYRDVQGTEPYFVKLNGLPDLSIKILIRFFSYSYKTMLHRKSFLLLQAALTTIARLSKSLQEPLNAQLKKSLKTTALNVLNLAVGKTDATFLEEILNFCTSVWAPKPMLIVALEDEHINGKTLLWLLQKSNTDINNLIWGEKSFIARAGENRNLDKISSILSYSPNSHEDLKDAAKKAKNSTALSSLNQPTPSSLFASASAPTLFASDEKPSNDTPMTSADAPVAMQTDNQQQDGETRKRKLNQ